MFNLTNDIIEAELILIPDKNLENVLAEFELPELYSILIGKLKV